MNINAKYSSLLAKTRKTVAFWAQVAKRDFTDDLLEWMERRKIKQARLAELLDVSPQFVTKVLRTNANLTIETMTKLAMALGCQVRIHMADQHAQSQWLDSPADVTRVAPPMNSIVPFDRSKIRTAMYGSSELPQVVNG